MVSYVDVCVFSQNLTTIQRLSRDEARDITRFGEEERNVAFERFIPVYNGQYHIDFWLSKVEISFVNSSVPEEIMYDHVIRYLSEDVYKAYHTMQWSRIRRGEATIQDWPTLKTLLRCVFLPLREQLHPTISLNHQPSPLPKKVDVSDLLRKLDSLSLCSCSCSINKDVINNKINYDKLERDVQSLKEKIDASYAIPYSTLLVSLVPVNFILFTIFFVIW